MKKLVSIFMVLMVSIMCAADEPVSYEDEIVVKGEAVTKTATVSTVTAEEIKNQGAETVADALELVPGVYVRVGGKGEAYVRMRGFRQREIAVLIDGLPIASPYDGQIDLSSLPVDLVERIEVVKGAASVMYGSNAMGGVINIITKKSDGTEQKTFSAQYGSGKSSILSTSVQGRLNTVRYMAMVTKKDQDYFPLSSDYESMPNQEPGHRDNSDRSGWQSMVTLGWDTSANSRHTVTFRGVDNERGLPHHESDPKAKYWRFNEWKTSGLDWIYEKTFGGTQMKTKVFYNSYKNTLDGYDDASYTTQDGRYGFTSKYDDTDFGGDVFFKTRLKNGALLKYAFRYRKDQHKDQEDIGEPWYTYEGSYLSLPVEYERSFSSGWTMVAGVSFDMMKIDEYDGVDAHNETEINPQLAFLKPLSDRLNIKFSASRKTRFPTLKELYSSTSGNPELESMKNVIVEAGLEFIPFDGLNVSLVAFDNNVTDMIYRVRKNDPYINIAKASFKGFELDIFWAISRHVVLHTAYTHLKSKDESDVSVMDIEHRPEHKFDLTLDVLLPGNIKCYLSGSHVSSQMYILDGEEARLDNFSLLNLKLSKEFGMVEGYAMIKNITDELYYESEGYPLEGRTWFAGLSARF